MSHSIITLKLILATAGIIDPVNVCHSAPVKSEPRCYKQTRWLCHLPYVIILPRPNPNPSNFSGLEPLPPPFSPYCFRPPFLGRWSGRCMTPFMKGTYHCSERRAKDARLLSRSHHGSGTTRGRCQGDKNPSSG